MLRHCKCT